ncbi:MAG: Mut7-C RNAse domain-containing protein [Candidatus Micrarchaeota archaeon]
MRMNFVADVMLARLARWLRMLGVRVSPPRSQSDDDIIRQCIGERAVLVTRDVALSVKSSSYCRCLLLRSSDLDGQVLEFCRAAGLDLSAIREDSVPSTSVCPECSGRLKKTPKKSLEGKVPRKSWLHAAEFLVCGSCGKAYWRGSHNAKILAGLRRMKRRFRRAGTLSPA